MKNTLTIDKGTPREKLKPFSIIMWILEGGKQRCDLGNFVELTLQSFSNKGGGTNGCTKEDNARASNFGNSFIEWVIRAGGEGAPHCAFGVRRGGLGGKDEPSRRSFPLQDINNLPELYQVPYHGAVIQEPGI